MMLTERDEKHKQANPQHKIYIFKIRHTSLKKVKDKDFSLCSLIHILLWYEIWINSQSIKLFGLVLASAEENVKSRWLEVTFEFQKLRGLY